MNRLTTKEMVRAFEEQKDPIQLYKDMDLFINSFSLRNREFLEEMKVQEPKIRERWTLICLLWVLKLASFYENGFYDLRNAKSCEYGYVFKNNFVGTFPDIKDYKFENDFVELMAKNHRTLQQNFSRLVFGWFIILSDEGKIPYGKLIEITSRQIESLPYI